MADSALNAATSIDIAVRNFASYLAASWAAVSEIAKLAQDPESVRNDWVQASWELLVERGLLPGQFLHIYGCGADCNNGSSRVYQPTALPTHVIACFARNTSTLYDLSAGTDVIVPETGYVIDKLVSRMGHWHQEAPPFDHVLIQPSTQIQHLFRLIDVRFVLREILPGEV